MNGIPNESQLLTLNTAAIALSVSTSTLRRWGKEGQIELVHLPGRSVRVRRADIERMLAGEAVS